MIIINTDTEYYIEYVILINGLRLYNEDREIILRTEITDITTAVLGEDKNPGREYCLNWCTVSKMSIKGH